MVVLGSLGGVILFFDGITFGYRRGAPLFESWSWRVPRGRTVLLGPNGAGKSTLMSLGSTSRSPWSGRVVLEHGQDQVSEVRKLRRAIGWMPQQSRAVPGLRCREQVAYFGWLKGMSRVQAWQGAEARLADVGLTAAADRRASSLSGGQLRRLGLAQVLVASPRLLLLDEPTAGLDPAQRARFRRVLDALVRTDEVSVVVSTHQVDDLSEIFEYVVVLDAATIRFAGTVGEFLHLSTDDRDDLRRAESAYAAVIGGED